MTQTALPTGTVTFLFTDIEGSTRLLQELGERYDAVLAEHHRAIREAIARHGGVEMSEQGDAFAVAFARVSDAVGAARDVQAALASSPVRVRMGLHTGEPRVVEDGYRGVDVHRAARVSAAAHGGQVILSDTTRALLDAHTGVRDLGEHRLKDLAEPIRLFQLGHGEFPPLRTLSDARLPPAPEPLVGRKKELADLLRLLGGDRCRVVTLTGPGGIGKTRLAVAAAAELVESFDDGATLVELAAVRDPALVLPTIADALGADGDPAAYLDSQQHLLVLDNVEQVVRAAPEIGALVADCPRLAVLATSREPLRIAGEREFPVKPLPDAPAVELFRQRAEAVSPGFDGDYDLLVEICRRLDSLPLAIELAAARTKLLPPDELLRRLDRRLSVLTSGRRDLTARQQTLRGAIEWSHELLTPEEQQLFARLAVFSGGWTLDAAELVCDAELDVLASLLDKSLVRREGERFSMLETIREYAAERLEDSGEADEVRRRHAEYLAELADASARFFRGHEQAPLRERFRAEWDNIRAAIGWALERGEIELGLRIAGSLSIAWLDRNVAVEGEVWLRRLLERADGVDETTRAKALITASMIAGVRNNAEQALQWGSEGLERFRAIESEEGVAWSLTVLAVEPLEHGNPEDAADMLEEAERLHRKHADAGGLRRVLHLRGQQAVAVGDLDRGRRLLREAAELSRAEGDDFSAASSIHSLGDAELEAGALAAAGAAYDDALRISWEIGSDRLVCYCLAGVAATTAARGDSPRAALLWGAAEAYEAGLRFTMRKRELYERICGPAAQAHRDRYGEGRTLDVDAAVRIALSLD